MSVEESSERQLTRLLDEYGRVLRDAVARVCQGPLGLQRDEIEQEAKIRLWRTLRRETTVVDFRLYLHRIVATAAIDAMRQIRSRKEVPLELPDTETAGTSLLALTPSGGPSPERIAAGRELAGRARPILGNKPPNSPRAVNQHHQGFNAQEIANLLGWSEPKARNLVYRGLADLREDLESDSNEREITNSEVARDEERPRKLARRIWRRQLR
jgi:RNA polymerase sigma factor (sigma-70 family)